MNGYICTYRGTTIEVHADTSYNAQTAAFNIVRDKFPRRKVRAWEISVYLAEKDGEQVTTTITN